MNLDFDTIEIPEEKLQSNNSKQHKKSNTVFIVNK